MFTLSYNLSSFLKDQLHKIELIQLQILSFPLSPKTEIRLRWEAMLKRVYLSLALSKNPLNKTEITKLLALSQMKRRLTRPEQEVVNYKKAWDYIFRNWLVSSKTITPKTIFTLHELACPGKFRSSEENLKYFLDYLQTNPENPVIQSAIAQIQTVNTTPFQDGNGRTARLLAYLFLYKYGYDFRGLLVLEEYWHRDLTAFQRVTQNALKSQSLTLWLEYFAQGVAVQLEKTLADLKSERSSIDMPSSFWELNNRQKEILSILEQPETTITNRRVQQLFKISQITASRDLAKLASLGLIFTNGKGRSVYYTKV